MTTRIPASFRLVGLALALGAAALVAGCAGPKCDTCGPPLTCVDNDQTTPTQVLEDMVCAYKLADCAGYANLLATDFNFWFDPATRPAGVPEFWSRLPDSTATCRLLGDNSIRTLLITLTYGPEEPDGTLGHNGWRRIRVTNTQIQIERLLNSGATASYFVEGDVQDLYFRRGRTAADTLAASPTAGKWYLVEWHDRGNPVPAAASLRPRAARPAAQTLTWGELKAIYR